MLTIENRKIGSFKLDATVTETHRSTLMVTSNPVESGAKTHDHAQMQPQTVTIEGVIVDYEPPHISLPIPDDIPFLSGANRLRVLPPLEIDLPFVVQQARQVWSDYKVVNEFIRSNAKGLAPFLPDLSTSATKSGRVAQYHADLTEIQRMAEPLEIMTGTKLYKSMLLVDVTVTQDNDHNAKFVIVAQELITRDKVRVNIDRTALGKGAGAIGGRAGTLYSKPVNRTAQPQPAGKTVNKSLLKSTRDYVVGGN